LLYTFDLSPDDKLTQRGAARPPTADEVAEWEAAGFTAPGKPAQEQAGPPAEDTIRSDLQVAMEAAGWTAEVAGPGNTIWTKRQNGERYTALLMGARDNRPMFMEVTVLADGGVDTGIAELSVKSAAQVARDANKAVADSEAESAPASEAKAPEPQPEVDAAPAAEPVPAGGFDSAAWDKDRNDRIKASREAGNVHLDTLDAYVETMRGKSIRSVHDPKVKGTIFTVDNNRNVFVDWADAYSQEKEGAVPMQYGKRKFMQSTLGPRDLKDYVLDVPAAPQVSTRTPEPDPVPAPSPATAPAPTNPPAPPEQTRPERLIELRKRQSVLKQLLECLG